MTEPYSRLGDATLALENPNLSLLQQKLAPAVLARLTPIEQLSIPVDRKFQAAVSTGGVMAC